MCWMHVLQRLNFVIVRAVARGALIKFFNCLHSFPSLTMLQAHLSLSDDVDLGPTSGALPHLWLGLHSGGRAHQLLAVGD